MKISVLIPTRNRIESLIPAIRSLLDNTSKDNEIEILLRFDDDDLNSVETVKQNISDNRIKYFIGPRLGLFRLDQYMNELSKKSEGDWLMFGNDDMLMQTKDFDKEIEKYNGRMVFIILCGGVFHIIPRKLVDIWGDIYRCTFCDSHINGIAGIVGNGINLGHISLLHLRESVYTHPLPDGWRPPEYWGPECTAIREHYAQLLKAYIELNKVA